MKKIKELNINVISDHMIITAHVKKESDDILAVSTTKPTFLNVQQVLAIGPRVHDVKVGDWVYMDFSQFEREVTVQSDMIAGVGGAKRQVKELHLPIFASPGDPDMLFKISERNIEGIIKDYDKLPDEMTEAETIEEYHSRKHTLLNDVQALKDKFNDGKEKGKLFLGDKVEAPAVFAEGKFRN